MPFLPFLIIGGLVVVFIIVASRRRTKAMPVDREQLLDLQNQWRAPGELLSSPMPRPVRLTGQAKLLVAFFIFFLCGAVAFAYFGISAIERDDRKREMLGREGVNATATIMRKWTVRSKSTSYYVLYNYEVGGQIYHRQARVSSSVYSRLSPGSQVAIRYAASDPLISRLDLEQGAGPWWIVLIPVGAFVLVMTLMPLPILAQKKLLQWGQPVGAIVTRVAPVKNGKSVSYQFLDTAGNVVHGSTTAPTSRAPEAGQTITVLFDPDRPRRNSLYPPQMVKLDLPAL